MSLFPRKDAKQRPARTLQPPRTPTSWPTWHRLQSTRPRAPTGTTSMETTPIVPPIRCRGCGAHGPASTRAPWPGTRRFAQRSRRQAPTQSSGSLAGPSRTWTRTAFPKLPSPGSRSRASALASRGARAGEQRGGEQVRRERRRVLRTPSVTVGPRLSAERTVGHSVELALVEDRGPGHFRQACRGRFALAGSGRYWGSGSPRLNTRSSRDQKWTRRR